MCCFWHLLKLKKEKKVQIFLLPKERFKNLLLFSKYLLLRHRFAISTLLSNLERELSGSIFDLLLLRMNLK